MGFSDHLARLGDAIDRHLTDPATWTGIVDAVPVILREDDEALGWGEGRLAVTGVVIEVRKANVPQPVEGDVLQVNARAFRVNGAPLLDDGAWWICPVEEITP